MFANWARKGTAEVVGTRCWSGRAREGSRNAQESGGVGERVSEKPTQSGSAAWADATPTTGDGGGTRLKGCEPVTSGAKSAATGSAGERQTRRDWARKEQVRRDQL
ncbi:hypothetical protein ERJ75_001720000 [Trypanosoma vivax]|nr:hypothetical protein ERJ75_001720000 [Trypanosoma vivax]